MLSRLALLGCAAAGLALAVPARATTEVDQEITTSEAAPVQARAHARRIVRRPVRVNVLPPARPSDVAGFAGPTVPTSDGSTGASFEARAGIPVPEAPAPLVITAEAGELGSQPTALRASLPEATPPAIEPVVTAQVRGTPVPPRRPDLVELSAPAAPALVVMLPPQRPAFEPDPVETASLPEAPAPVAAPAERPRSLFGALFNNAAPVAPAPVVVRTGRAGLDDLIAIHAKLNAVPADLVHRVVVRESRYNPAAVGRGGAMGLMQIKHATARAMGYGGTAAGLLDAETNITYAVKYLAGAYRVAGGNYDGAVRNYARGYYYAAKRQRLAETGTRASRRERLRREANASTALDWAPGTEMSLPAQAGGTAPLRR